MLNTSTTAPAKKAAGVSKRKRTLKPQILKGKNLSHKKIKCMGNDGKPIQPGFREVSRLVNHVGENQVGSVYDTGAMAKIGLAVMKFGSDSKQVRQAQAEAKEINRKTALEFVGGLYRLYKLQLEKYKVTLDLPVCCICLDATDDFEVRDNWAIRQIQRKEEAEEDQDPALLQFVRLANLPAGISIPGGVTCNCKTTAVCMPCFFKLIRASGVLSCIHVQCPTCRVIFSFKVGVLPQSDDPLVMINGIKPSAAGQCPFRVPRLEEPDAESSNDDDDAAPADEEEAETVNQVPRPARTPSSSSPGFSPHSSWYSPRGGITPPRDHSPRGYPWSPVASPHYSPSSPPCSPPSTPPPLPKAIPVKSAPAAPRRRRRSGRLRKSTLLNLEGRGTRLFKNHKFQDTSSDDCRIISVRPKMYQGASGEFAPSSSSSPDYSDDEKIAAATAEDRDFVVFPDGDGDYEEEKPEEKPEDGGVGYNHHPKWPKTTNQAKEGRAFIDAYEDDDYDDIFTSPNPFICRDAGNVPPPLIKKEKPEENRDAWRLKLKERDFGTFSKGKSLPLTPKQKEQWHNYIKKIRKEELREEELRKKN